LKGKDLRDAPLLERRAKLRELIPVNISALSGVEKWTECALTNHKLERCPIPKLRIPDAQWVKPQLMARVRHLAGSKYLRHATILGLR